MNTTDHDSWMRRCLDLARRGAGTVGPNPLVGSIVLGAAGTVLGEGWHQQYGGPHAEVHAIAAAEQGHGAEALRTATLYVNLEPCSHHGKTPPCANLILEKGIPRVVVGMVDPSPKVAGQGLARLRDHGVEVTVGVLENTCCRFNEAFVHHVHTGQPLVTLKVAQTLDGAIATATGDSRWVSGMDARHRTHQWRAELDGILVGSGTARQDDPALTVRHVEGRQPLRFVLDREGTLPASLRLFSDAHRHLTTAFVGETTTPGYAEALEAAGGRVVSIPVANGHLDLSALLDWLGREGGREGNPLQSLLVEAGPGLATALWAQDLVDRYFVFIASKLVGGGVSTLHNLGIDKMDDALTFAEQTWERVGEDLLFRGYRRALG